LPIWIAQQQRDVSTRLPNSDAATAISKQEQEGNLQLESPRDWLVRKVCGAAGACETIYTINVYKQSNTPLPSTSLSIAARNMARTTRTVERCRAPRRADVHGPLTASSKPSSATSGFSVSSYTHSSAPNHSAQAADVTRGVALKVIPKEKVKGTRRACGAKCRSSWAPIIPTSYVPFPSHCPLPATISPLPCDTRASSFVA
jgi:hypothetical protein